MPNYDAVHAVRFDGLYRTDLDLDTAGVPIAQEVATPYGTGTGANQCNAIFSDSYTQAGVLTLDLTGGLTDPLGNVTTFTKLRGLWIRMVNASGVTLSVAGNFITTRIGATIVVPEGGLFYMEAPSAGWVVTNGSVDTITITPSTNGTFQVRVWGTV